MLALLLMFAFSFLGYLIGNRLALRLSDKRRYFEELISLIERLNGDFRFRQSSVCELINKQKFKSELLNRNLSEFCAFAQGETATLNLCSSNLNESERKCVFEMFSALGRYDLDTQLIILQDFKDKIEGFYQKAVVQENKMSGAYRKIGALCGLMIGILTV